MDSLSMKGSMPAMAYAGPRPTERQENAAQTELAAPKSVPQAGKIEEHQDMGKRPQMAQTQKTFEVDPETAEFVFKAVDTRTGETVNQLPAETILKLRAYAKEGAQQKESRVREHEDQDPENAHVDREA